LVEGDPSAIPTNRFVIDSCSDDISTFCGAMESQPMTTIEIDFNWLISRGEADSI
jgi:hypothetical protein